jgi:hypothetical protein
MLHGSVQWRRRECQQFDGPILHVSSTDDWRGHFEINTVLNAKEKMIYIFVTIFHHLKLTIYSVALKININEKKCISVTKSVT